MTYNYAPLIGLVPETSVSINKDFILRWICSLNRILPTLLVRSPGTWKELHKTASASSQSKIHNRSMKKNRYSFLYILVSMYYVLITFNTVFVPFIDVNSGINQTSHLLFSLEID